MSIVYVLKHTLEKVTDLTVGSVSGDPHCWLMTWFRNIRSTRAKMIWRECCWKLIATTTAVIATCTTRQPDSNLT